MDPTSGNPEIDGSPSIHLGQLRIKLDEAAVLGIRSARTIDVFGAKVYTGEERKGVPLFRNALLVVDDTGTVRTEHHLAQRNHTIYHAAGDTPRSEIGDMLAIDRVRRLHRPPKWKHADAEIPLHGNETFFFLVQFYAKRSRSTSEYFGNGQTIYLFAVADGDALKFQAFLQDTSEQTAEDHYRLEEQMMEFDRDYRDIDKVEALIKAGDGNLHRYIAEHARSREEILVALLRHARTKRMKQQIQKRLRKA